MLPQDIIWRITERLTELQALCEESIAQLHPRRTRI